MVSSLYFFLAQLGEPAKRRRIFDFGSNTNRQGGIPNPLDFIFGFLDGQLSYATTLRFIVFYGLGVNIFKLITQKNFLNYFPVIWSYSVLGFDVNTSEHSAREETEEERDEAVTEGGTSTDTQRRRIS